jgi:uncharacterized protein (TIRG00374 family)
MSPTRKKVFAVILRTVVCVAAMYIVLRSVSLRDWAHLPDGRTVQILEWPAGDERLDDPQRRDQVEIVIAEPPGRIRLGELARDARGDPRFEIGLLTAWKNCQWRHLLAALLLFAPVPIIQSIRFTWMVRAQDISLSYWEGIKLSVAGNFLNFVVLGSTGGDIFKAYYVACHTDRKVEAVTTVLLDRAVGLISLVLIAILAMLVRFNDPLIRQWVPLVALIGAGTMAVVTLVFSRRVRAALRLEQLIQRLPFSSQLQRIDAATLRMRQHKKLVVSAMAVTLVLQGLAITSMIVAAAGLGLRASAEYIAGYYVYLSIALLVMAVPVSYQGLGTMDAVLQVFLRGTYGNYSQVLFLGFAMRLLQLAWSLPGVLVPITGAHRPSSRKMAELQALAATSKS